MAFSLPILRLLLLLQCAAVALSARYQRPDDMHTVAPLESCKPFAALDSAELTGFRNLNQLLQAKKRRHTELSWFIEFKLKPRLQENEIAMWNSSRTMEDLQADFHVVNQTYHHLRLRAEAMWATIRQKAKLPEPSQAIDSMHCFMGKLNQELHPYRPKISILLQYWQRRNTIERFMAPLMKCKDQVPLEVVVNVDHPADADLWLDWAYNKTLGLVVPVFSHNLHEIRAYNRLAAIARGTYLVLAQDDQIFQDDCSWMTHLMALFRKYPRLGAMGHRSWCDSLAIHKICLGFTTNFREPTLDIPFQFVGVADYAPYTFRRTTFMDIGGLDEGASEPGQCGIISDWEVSTRVWLAGWQVGYMHVPVSQDSAQGSTHVGANAHRCWGKQNMLTGGMFGERIRPPAMEEILRQLVQQANLGLNLTKPNNECPYLPEYCDKLPYKMPAPEKKP